MPAPKPAKIHNLNETAPIAKTKRRTWKRKTGIYTPITRLPKPPSTLNQHGKKEWKAAGELLVDAKLLRKSDLKILELYASSYGQWKEATLKHNKLRRSNPDELFVRLGLNGQPSIQLLVKIIDKARIDCLRFAKEFGFTPISRASLGIHMDDNDPAADLLSK